MAFLKGLCCPSSGCRPFSPYSDGEKGLAAASALFQQRRQIGETIGDSVLLPVTIRGEVPGRAMRGGATFSS
ncbi:MAG: hypothetical protein EOS86_32840 [Mesorhizobium sp.]|nr:MAG: hypothetical protein EOS86_32840 [Mesorhizobium sp.]